VILAWCVATTGSYDSMFRILAAVVGGVAAAALIIQLPANGAGAHPESVR
jgi:hypothetical protein